MQLTTRNRLPRSILSPLLTRELVTSDVEQLLSDFFTGNSVSTKSKDQFAWAPSVDISENDSSLTVKAEIPGVDVKDLDVSVADGVLTIKGEKHQETKEANEQFHRIERRFGSFLRSIPLPESIDGESINADFKNGILTVTAKKSAKSSPKKITVSPS